MRKYELTYLVSDDVLESDMNKVTGEISGYISDLQGKIDKEESWGRRKLSYPISKNTFATYMTLYFELEPENLLKVDREIRSNKHIIRHLLIIRDYGKEELTLKAEEIAETKDIKAVVGGERSFEAVEGETEESRDLMLKRADEEEAETPTEETIENIEEEATPKTPKKEEIKDKVTEQVEEKPKAPKKAKSSEVSEIPAEEIKEVNEKVKEEIPDIKPNKVTKKTPEKAPVKTEKPASIKEKAPVKPKKSKIDDEVDRLTKLDEELDQILGDDL